MPRKMDKKYIKHYPPPPVLSTVESFGIPSDGPRVQSLPLFPKIINKTKAIPSNLPELIPISRQDPNRKISEDTLLENATERVRETESFAQEQSNLKRKGEPLIEESSSPWKKTRLDKKPKRTWEAVLALCEDFKFHQDCYPLLHLILKDFTIEEARDKIEQATKEVAEKVSEESGRMEAGPMGPHYPWLGPHYHALPTPRAPDLQAASLYKIPPALYPRPVPFPGFPFPLIRATPYHFAHTVPSTTYTIPCHEVCDVSAGEAFRPFL
nr:uncharacterized protein LOC106678758 isoform X2 [Halyomorpha halys]